MKFIFFLFIIKGIRPCKTVVVIHGLREGPESIEFLKNSLEEVWYYRVDLKIGCSAWKHIFWKSTKIGHFFPFGWPGNLKIRNPKVPNNVRNCGRTSSYFYQNRKKHFLFDQWRRVNVRQKVGASNKTVLRFSKIFLMQSSIDTEFDGCREQRKYIFLTDKIATKGFCVGAILSHKKSPTILAIFCKDKNCSVKIVVKSIQ